MGSTSAVQSSSALAILRATRTPSSGTNYADPLSLLRSGVTRASSERIQSALKQSFTDSADLRDLFAKTFKATYDGLSKYVTWQAGAEAANSDDQRAATIRNAAHNALVDVIMTNRDKFPPEGFSIRTEYPDGAWGTTEIPPGRSSPADYKTTVQTIDKFFAELPPGVSSSIMTSGRTAQALANVSSYRSDAAIQILDAALKADDTAARKRAEMQYDS